MPTPSIQTLVTDAQQILNLDSISAVRSVVAVALANANTGTPLNPNLTTQQLWNEFYQVVNKPKSDIESIIANQLMKLLYAPPAPGGAGANTQVMFNDNGFLAGDSGMTYDKVANALTLLGNLTVRTNKLAVTSTGTGFGTASPGAAYIADFLGDVRLTGAQTLIGNQSITGDSVINGSLTVTGAITSSAANSAIRAAASDYAAVNFDGATASTRITSGCQAIGTGDFSLWSRFRVPTSFGSGVGVLWLTDSSTTTIRPNSIGIFLTSTDLRVLRYGATAPTDSRTAAVASFLTNFVGQVVDVVVTRAGNTLKIYINGTDTAYTENTGGTPPAWGQTVVSDFTITGAFSTNPFTGRIYRSVVFNRALSAADVTELITTGVNPADQWGSQTAAYTSDFSAGADGWSATNGTAAGNIDGIGGQDNNLRYTIGSGANSGDGVSRNATVIPSKRYRFDFSYYIPSGQTQITTLRAFSGLTSVVTGLNVTNAWTAVSAEGVATGDTLIRVNQNFVGTGNGTDVFYIRAVTVTRIGAIVDLDFTVGTGYQATDRSTNALHGTLFNGVEFTIPKRIGVVYATTNTNGNQQMLGTLAIPTNAIIEDIIVNSTGSATVSIGNVSAGTQIVNGASVVSGRQKLTIATPFSTTGNLWVNSNATATLQFTILYTVAA